MDYWKSRLEIWDRRGVESKPSISGKRPFLTRLRFGGRHRRELWESVLTLCVGFGVRAGRIENSDSYWLRE